MTHNKYSWPLAALAVFGAFAVMVPNAVAAFTSTATVQSNSAHAGTLSTIFVDANGSVLSSPIMQITNAQPGMAAQTTAIRIKNVGSLPASARVHSINVSSATSPSLNDVLLATITDSNSHVLYSGNVSGIDVALSSIAATSQSVLDLSITWPDLPNVDDNPYQDSALSFEIALDATSI
ncbi:MAG: hypothetical protein RL410_1241 [Actinomycetota bacterium]|jgi:hypothetical protein